MPYFRSLIHSGTPHDGMIPHSGRYEYGSGKERFQHESNIVKTYERLAKNGFTDTEIAKSMNYSSVDEMQTKMADTGLMRTKATSDLLEKVDSLKKRGMSEAAIAIELNYGSVNKLKMAIKVENAKIRSENDRKIQNYLDQGYTNISEIARLVGVRENYVRARLANANFNKKSKSEEIADLLKVQIEKYGAVDVGAGSEHMLGITENKLSTAIKLLKEEGYKQWYFTVPQAENPTKETTITALVKPDAVYKEINAHKEDIGLVTDYFYTEDNGRSIRGIEKPSSIDSSRVLVRFGNEGGKEKDGFIQIRRGVEDLSLGNNLYAQSRIVVDNKYYLKGMAAYSDDSEFPPGIDIIFNTKKNSDEYTKLGTMKELKTKIVKDPETGKEHEEIDWDNPFKSTLKTEDGKIVGQSHYFDKNGNEKLGCINIVREEGDWDNWGKSLSAQFLSKQPLELINQQLNKTYKQREDEFKSIIELTQPEVKASLLRSFADDCDKAASELKALKLPGQSTKVILPVTSLKPNEVYAPTYPDGEELILIRYPHGGTFEIPRVYNNTNNKEGQEVISPLAQDAIGISSASASQLSGADYDGDTVVVIPVRGLNIISDRPLEGLKDFDTDTYVFKDGRKSDIDTQMEMGKITNLITDMQQFGADLNELERAVKHSMVVIDSEKHNLDYKKSFKDNGIAALQEKYQKEGGGASTLISKASSEANPLERVEKTTFKIRTNEEQKWFEEHEQDYLNDSLDKYDKNKWINIRNKLTPEEYDLKMQGHKIYARTYKTHSSYTIIKQRTPEQQKWLDDNAELYENQMLKNKDRKKYKTLLEETMTPEKFKAKLLKINDGEKPKGKTQYSITKDGDIRKTVIGKPNTDSSTKMAEVSDAFELIEGRDKPATKKEIAYGNYANKMKALANEARKETYSIVPSRVNPEAKKEYADEISSLMSKLQLVYKNRPLERKAQAATDAYLAAAKKDNPDMSKEDIKKFRLQTIIEQRRRLCSNKREYEIFIEPREWEAIMKGALSSSKINDLLKSVDTNQIREYATPSKTHSVPPATVGKIKALLASVHNGYPTLEDIAADCGVSVSTVKAYAK